MKLFLYDKNLDTISLETAMRLVRFSYENRKLFEMVENERKSMPNITACGATKEVTKDGIPVYLCSRAKGHKGLHVASGTKEIITFWK